MNHVAQNILIRDLIPAKTRTLLAQTLHTLSQTYASIYLVGGALRNLLLAQPCVDWDIALPTDSRDLATAARKLAHNLGGFYAHLHEKADRIIVKGTAQEIVIDLSPMDGATIEADLSRRDFTVNAIAIPLHAFTDWLTTYSDVDFMHAIEHLAPLCIDPYHGIVDSRARRLRAVSDTIFVRDPLRLLRALRLATRYHLASDAPSRQLIQRDAPLLPQVASERIYAELAPLLEPPGAAQRLHLLDNLRLFTAIFPEFIPLRSMPQSQPHYGDVFHHALATVALFEQLAQLLSTTPFPGDAALVSFSTTLPAPHLALDAHDRANLQAIHILLQEAQQQALFDLATLRKPFMKLAALLHGVGKGATHIARRLHLPAQERRLIEQVAANHTRLQQLAQQPITPLVQHHYFVALGTNGIPIALIALAAALASYGLQPAQWRALLSAVRLLLTGYIRNREQILPPRLLQGDALMQQLDLQPGPLIGQLLTTLSEAQVTGQVHTPEEALRFARQWLQETH